MTRGAGKMTHRGSSTWLNAVHFPGDPERNLLAAVVKSAVRDIRRGRPYYSATARAYFDGPNFEADAALLGIDARLVRRLLQEKSQ